MRPAIEERMNNQIQRVRVYNTLFDLVVTAVEVETGHQAINPVDNQYLITVDPIRVAIMCNDNDGNTVSIYIDTTGDESIHLADIQINSDGGVEENYHNIPISLRTNVINIVNAVCDAIDGWINYRDEIKEDIIDE